MTVARTICLGFLAVIAVGTLLLMLPFATQAGTWNDPVVALFTSTSAVCITGLAVVDTGSYYSFWGQLAILLLIQVGGLGYMTTNTFLLLLIGRRFDLRQRFALQETVDRPFVLDSRQLIRAIVMTAFLFELVATILLLPAFSRESAPLWQAIFHSISAWNNAGFSLLRDGLVSYRANLVVNFTISTLVILGGLGYQVIFEVWSWVRQRQQRRSIYNFSIHFKVVTSTTLVLLGAGFVAFLIIDLTGLVDRTQLGTGEKLLAAWFQSMTTRTAGFSTVDIGAITDAALFVTIGFMFVGASPSGTGGGIKTTTLRVLIATTRAALLGQREVTLYERRVPNTIIMKAIAMLFGSAALTLAVTVLLAWFNPQIRFIELLFESVSAFATVGLSTGITAQVTVPSQLILIGTMYAGRVGVLVLMGAIVGEPPPSVVQYPEENLLVG